MPFDPCGTRKLEGEDILKRLAEYLGVDKEALKQTLIELADAKQVDTFVNKITLDNH